MNYIYQNHRASFLRALGNATTRYVNDASAGLSIDGELLRLFADALSEKGCVRLYKYQPFTERNLQDCEAGVLHLSRLDDLNDVNEGWHTFDRSVVERKLSSIDAEQIDKLDMSNSPTFIKDMVGDNGLQRFGEVLKGAQESGTLKNAIAPAVANNLAAQFVARRGQELCGSLSEVERSASMWDRYGNGHRGFVVGYTVDSFLADFSTGRTGTCKFGFKALLAPVFYGERYDLSFVSSVASVRDPSSNGATNLEVLYLALSLLQKAKEWEYEQEWRVISYACMPESKAHYCKLKPDSIYLGLRMQKDERNRAIEVARRNDWRVFEMKLSDRSLDWTLDAVELVEA